MGIPVHESLLPAPEPYGTPQSATVGLPWANEVFYCGLAATDEAGNRGPVSNLVPVYAAEFTTTTDQETSLVYGLENEAYSLDKALSSYILDDFNRNPTVYIVAGVVTGAVFILVVIVGVTILRSRRRAAARKNQSAKARSQVCNSVAIAICPRTYLRSCLRI